MLKFLLLVTVLTLGVIVFIVAGIYPTIMEMKI